MKTRIKKEKFLSYIIIGGCLLVYLPINSTAKETGRWTEFGCKTTDLTVCDFFWHSANGNERQSKWWRKTVKGVNQFGVKSNVDIAYSCQTSPRVEKVYAFNDKQVLRYWTKQRALRSYCQDKVNLHAECNVLGPIHLVVDSSKPAGMREGDSIYSSILAINSNNKIEKGSSIIGHGGYWIRFRSEDQNIFFETDTNRGYGNSVVTTAAIYINGERYSCAQ
jgi:hypothetical protein